MQNYITLNQKENPPSSYPSKIVVDIILKVCLLGDSQVGKTGFSDVLCGRSFVEKYVPNISATFKLKNKQDTKERMLELQICDTAGQKRYRSLLSTYLQGAQIVCVCFDLNKENGVHTNENKTINIYLRVCVNAVREHCSEDAKLMFIGCKSDSRQEANGNDKIGNAILSLGLDNNKIIKDSNSNNRLFFKTSAKTGDGFKEVQNAISSCMEVRGVETV
ncbi:MAG: Rab family GTPase [Candidatus Improbicoccus pseudotrichonymphae]|uniref:Rab family GTPase n=1 Tax=Candidatus Improbicoccus pseudotrichonymphae TaxID=3033792 RepID=A0AA48KYV1_9FIRM|nr:MAG: Rab family GTPase [Candidatus Improbicoccus pseudotrichonymphae]